VIDDMVNQSDWGELDYMIVDCPPGSSDVFNELVRALRPSISGAISVGISDAVSDTVRLVKVCNHNWVPILGFIENMTGVCCHGNVVECKIEEGKFKNSEHVVHPFGRGKIREFSEEVGGEFLGEIPLCVEDTEIRDVAGDTIENAVDAIASADDPPLPEENIGDKSFIRSVWGTVKEGIKRMNSTIDIESIQDEFGVENRDPLVLSLKLTDAGPITKFLDEIIITTQDGELKYMRPKKAQSMGVSVEAGIEITSQDLYNAIRGEKKVMRSVTGEVTSEPYSITKAVQMGDATIWGERTVNRLAVLDKILTEAVDMEEVRELANVQN
jgi:hypothetical protein